MTASEILDWVQVIGNRPAATFTYPDNHVEVEGYTVPCVDCPQVSEAYYPGGNGAPSPFTPGSGSDASYHSSMPSLASGSDSDSDSSDSDSSSDGSVYIVD